MLLELPLLAGQVQPCKLCWHVLVLQVLLLQALLVLVLLLLLLQVLSLLLQVLLRELQEAGCMLASGWHCYVCVRLVKLLMQQLWQCGPFLSELRLQLSCGRHWLLLPACVRRLHSGVQRQRQVLVLAAGCLG